MRPLFLALILLIFCANAAAGALCSNNPVVPVKPIKPTKPITHCPLGATCKLPSPKVKTSQACELLARPGWLPPL